MKRLKDIDVRIFAELMKNSKISDRQLAKKLHVSQPTITRRRAALERRRLLEYTAIPNFRELGFEIIAFSFVQYKPDSLAKLRQQEAALAGKEEATMEQAPNIILASSGSGLGFHGISISVHKSYSEYVEFRRKLEAQWGEYVVKIDSFIISILGDNIVRYPTMKFFADYLVKHGFE